MTEASSISGLQTSTDMSSVTFSQALEAGRTHYDWLDGRRIGPSLRDHALASHSVSPERVKALTTNDTFGLLFAGSSPSAGLQSSLASRLRQRLAVYGSPEYGLTWKHWDMRSGPPICALRGSVRRTSGKGCGGWATPNSTQRGAHTGENAGSLGTARRISEKGVAYGMTLQTMVRMAGWATPRANKTTDEKQESWEARNKRGEVATMPLTLQAQMAGWNSPRANDAEKRGMVANDPRNGLVTQANMAGWPTVTGQDAKNCAGSSQFTRNSLPLNTAIVAWIGTNPSGGPAGMDCIDEYLPDGWTIPEGGKLNGRFSLWLQGYPIEWAYSGERVTASSRKSRPSL